MDEFSPQARSPPRERRIVGSIVVFVSWQDVSRRQNGPETFHRGDFQVWWRLGAVWHPDLEAHLGRLHNNNPDKIFEAAVAI